MCNGEGEYVCRNNQCICQCAEEYPQCNCPITDIQIMESTLLGMSESWAASYKDFENSGKRKIPPIFCKLCFGHFYSFIMVKMTVKVGEQGNGMQQMAQLADQDIQAHVVFALTT